MVLVEVARQPNKAAQNPSMLKLSSVIEVRSMPPTIGIKDAQIRQSKYFLQISHCKNTVYMHRNIQVKKVKDLKIGKDKSQVYSWEANLWLPA